MKITQSLLALGGLAAAASASVLSHVERAPEPASTAKTNRLVPYHVARSNDILGLTKRADTNTTGDLCHLDPKPSAQLVWGSEQTSGSIFVANMTLHAYGNESIVSLEQFNHLTKSVDCNDNDGKLGVVFLNKTIYDYALDKWKYINDDEQSQFVIIANHDGCGVDMERQAYKVNKVDNDDAAFSVTFEATAVDFDQSGEGFDMTFGHATVPMDSTNTTKQLTRRLCFNNCDYSGNSVMPLDIGTANKAYDILSTSDIDVSCTNCFVSGSMKVAGALTVSYLQLKVKSMTVDVTPQDIKAALEITTTIHGGVSTGVKTFAIVPDTAIPGAGFSIASVLDFGLTTGLQAGVSLTADAAFTYTSGLDLSVPNDAAIHVDLKTLGSSSATGWDKTSITPVSKISSGNATLTGDVFLMPKIVLEASISKLGKAEIGFDLHLPQINYDAKITWDKTKGNVCGDGSNKDGGLDLALDGEISLDFILDGSLLGLFSDRYEKSLWSDTFFHYDHCFPVGDNVVTSTSSSKLPASTSSVKTTSASGKPIASANATSIAPSTLRTSVKPIGTAYSTGSVYISKNSTVSKTTGAYGTGVASGAYGTGVSSVKVPVASSKAASSVDVGYGAASSKVVTSSVPAAYSTGSVYISKNSTVATTTTHAPDLGYGASALDAALAATSTAAAAGQY